MNFREQMCILILIECMICHSSVQICINFFERIFGGAPLISVFQWLWSITLHCAVDMRPRSGTLDFQC